MKRLFLLLNKYKATLIFVCLEFLCVWIITTQNIFLEASFFNSSNNAVAKILISSNAVKDYLSLREVNETLSEENAILKNQIKGYEQSFYRLDTRILKDPELIGQYKFIGAKIINNSTHNIHNYITISAGEKQGIEKHLGVISANGMVGKIVKVSENYAVISSLLNADLMVSSKIKRTGHLGTVNWDGKEAQLASLLYIPRHVKPVLGDTIISSGYNAIFPEGVMIGTITNVNLPNEATFYQIEIKLANDFSKLSHIYVIKNNMKEEQQLTEQLVTEVND